MKQDFLHPVRRRNHHRGAQCADRWEVKIHLRNASPSSPALWPTGAIQVVLHNTTVSSPISTMITSQSMITPERQALTSSSPFWMELQNGRTGYFEIPLPRDYLQDAKRSFSIEWIDFFRQ
jgi:hypothetical protein